MTIEAIANAIFDNLYEDLIPKNSPASTEREEMLFKLFHFEKVKKIRETLEKCN